MTTKVEIEQEKEAKVAKQSTPARHSGKSYVEPPPAPLFDLKELKRWTFYRALVAEFIATLLFLYITVATVIGDTVQHATDPCDGVGPLGVAWSFGGMFFILVYCTAGISGGHINPAVTFGMFLARKVSVFRAIGYIIAQCLGAICGVGLVKAVMNTDDGANFLHHDFGISTGLGAEIIGSFVLVYFVFSATDPKRNARDSHISVLAPLPIGFAVFAVYLGSSAITGTGINPAWSLAVGVIFDSERVWDDHWIFWAGPFIGALLATAYHQYVLRASSFNWGTDDDDE